MLPLQSFVLHLSSTFQVSNAVKMLIKLNSYWAHPGLMFALISVAENFIFLYWAWSSKYCMVPERTRALRTQLSGKWTISNQGSRISPFGPKLNKKPEVGRWMLSHTDFPFSRLNEDNEITLLFPSTQTKPASNLWILEYYHYYAALICSIILFHNF